MHFLISKLYILLHRHRWEHGRRVTIFKCEDTNQILSLRYRHCQVCELNQVSIDITNSTTFKQLWINQ